MEKDIEYKIFKKEDIERLWNLINLEYEYSRQNGNHSSINMQISCTDKTRYESDNDDLFKDGEIIDIKKINSIEIDYVDFVLDRKIYLKLNQDSVWSSSNNIRVSGKDRDWIAGKFKKINDVIEATKPQKHWFLENKNTFLLIFAFTIGIFVNHITWRLFGLETPTFEEEGILWYFLLSSIVSGLFFAIPIVIWVSSLWPNIEFDFGPEHTKISKQKRNRLTIFFSIIGFPLILFIIGILIDLLTK